MWRFVFFFQAEDGIRDVAVTGVQTCALPIFFRSSLAFFFQSAPEDLQTVLGEQILAPSAALLQMKSFILSRVPPPPVARSEERRVGKECRSRWSPYH